MSYVFTEAALKDFEQAPLKERNGFGVYPKQDVYAKRKIFAGHRFSGYTPTWVFTRGTLTGSAADEMWGAWFNAYDPTTHGSYYAAKRFLKYSYEASGPNVVSTGPLVTNTTWWKYEQGKSKEIDDINWEKVTSSAPTSWEWTLGDDGTETTTGSRTGEVSAGSVTAHGTRQNESSSLVVTETSAVYTKTAEWVDNTTDPPTVIPVTESHTITLTEPYTLASCLTDADTMLADLDFTTPQDGVYVQSIPGTMNGRLVPWDSNWVYAWGRGGDGSIGKGIVEYEGYNYSGSSAFSTSAVDRIASYAAVHWTLHENAVWVSKCQIRTPTAIDMTLVEWAAPAEPATEGAYPGTDAAATATTSTLTDHIAAGTSVHEHEDITYDWGQGDA